MPRNTPSKAVATASPPVDNPQELLPWEEFAGDSALSAEEIEENRQALAALSNIESGGGGGGHPLLGLSKSNEWKLGVEGLIQDNGTLVAIDTRSAKQGWVLWLEGKPTEIMVSAFETCPPRPEPKEGIAWKAQREVSGVILSGPEKGSPFRYSTSSIGGVAAFTIWKDAVKKHGAIDPGHPHMVAALNVGGYEHKQYGWTATPEFRPKAYVASGIFLAALSGNASGPEILPPEKAPEEKRTRPSVTIDGNRRPRTRAPGATA